MRLPTWLKKKVLLNEKSKDISKIIGKYNLHTVCHEAKCPNRNECFASKTATFLILGNICTRDCSFCGIQKGIPKKYNMKEIDNILLAADKMNLNHIVITSVTRDDLPDGGASIYYEIINKLKNKFKTSTVEVLIPDLKGDFNSLKTILSAKPDVLNHNIETVPSLYKKIRNRANYETSLNILKYSKLNSKSIIKSGIILGLGETKVELIEVFKDLVRSGVDILTIGQYMRPSLNNIKVSRFLTPEEFEDLKFCAKEEGIKQVLSAPLVRSSYKAKETLNKLL